MRKQHAVLKQQLEGQFNHLDSLEAKVRSPAGWWPYCSHVASAANPQAHNRLYSLQQQCRHVRMVVPLD